MKYFKKAAAATLMAGGMILSGCGGGGGGGDGLVPVAPAPVTAAPPAAEKPAEPVQPPEITVDRSELVFVNVNGALPAYDTVTLSTDRSTGPDMLYMFVDPDDNLVDGDSYLDAVSDTSVQLTFAPQPQTRSVEGSLQLKLCSEDPCTKVVWSHGFPYRYRNYTIDAGEIRERTMGSVDMLVTRAIAPAATTSDLRVTASADGGGTWLKAEIDGNGALALRIAGSNLKPGNYSGEVRIGTANEAAGTLRIPVSITIGTGFTLPAPAEIALDASSPPTVGGKIAMGFNGGQALVWTATSDQPWLVLQQASGKGGGDVGYTIDTARLANLGNTGSATASVSFAAAGASPAIYRVVVRKNLPQIVSFTPNPLHAGQAAEVRVRGSGLRQLSGVGAIRIDNVPVAKGTILSDTEAIVSVPALAAGPHTVGLAVASGTASAQAVLNAAEAAATAQTLIDSDTVKSAILYGAGRQSLYTVSAGKLLRYRRSGAGWKVAASTAVAANARIGLSSDGAVLYTTREQRILEERDPDTLALRASHEDAEDIDYRRNITSGALPVTSDGKIWMLQDLDNRLRYFDVHTGHFANVSQPLVANKGILGANFLVAGDGGSMIVGEPGQGIEHNKGTLRYDAAKGTFGYLANVPDFGWHAYLSGDGGKLLSAFLSTVYDARTGAVLGKLSVANGNPPLPVLLSPDGGRAYLVKGAMDGRHMVWTNIDVVDTVGMKKIGEIALPAGVNVCSEESFDCPEGPLAISPFGDTIFWAGNKKIAVIPVPANFQAAPAALRFKRAR